MDMSWYVAITILQYTYTDRYQNQFCQQILEDFNIKHGEAIAKSMKRGWNDFIYRNIKVLADAVKNPRVRKTLLEAQSESGIEFVQKF